jgi:serine/threonine protein kinase
MTTNTSRFSTGSMLGKIRVQAKIPWDGVGEAFRGRDQQLQRDVLIVALEQSSPPDPNRLTTLRKSASMLQKVDHPAVSPVILVDSVDGFDYVVYGWTSADTLATRIREGRCSIRDVVVWGARIAEAMSAAHQAGILHGHLDSSMIGFDKENQPVVAGFGLGAVASPPDAADAVVRFSTSVAPELWQHQPVTVQSDVYGLGAVLYEAATGEPVFLESSIKQHRDAVLNGTPESPRRKNRTVSPLLNDLIVKCLDKNPALRFPMMGDLAKQIRSILSGQPSGESTRFFKPGTILSFMIIAVVVAWASFVWYRTGFSVAHKARDRAAWTAPPPAAESAPPFADRADTPTDHDNALADHDDAPADRDDTRADHDNAPVDRDD